MDGSRNAAYKVELIARVLFIAWKWRKDQQQVIACIPL